MFCNFNILWFFLSQTRVGCLIKFQLFYSYKKFLDIPLGNALKNKTNGDKNVVVPMLEK